MGRKRKYTSDVMINTVHEILYGFTSISLAANKLDKEGLTDKRGKRTPIEDLSEIVKLKRENKFLKQQLEYKEMESILLKSWKK